MRFTLLTFSCIAVLFTSCGTDRSGNSGQQAEHKPSLPPSSKLGDTATQQLMGMVTDYYAMKEAFVKENAATVVSTAKTLESSAASLKETILSDSLNAVALQPALDTIIEFAGSITKLYPEGAVEKSRPYFEKISDNMFALLKTAELKNARVYRQFCPMAFNDKGAYWLSSEEEIRNPYFGKKMLECGEVTDSLK